MGNINSEHVTVDNLTNPMPVSGTVAVSGTVPVSVAAAVSTNATIVDVLVALYKAIKDISTPIWFDQTTGTLKVLTDSSGNLGTVTTVSTVTNLSQFGGVSAADALYNHLMNQEWALCVRARIS